MDVRLRLLRRFQDGAGDLPRRNVLQRDLLGQLVLEDFRHNPRGTLGTRTSTLHAGGIAKLRSNWVYNDQPVPVRRPASRGSASRAKSK